MNVYDTLTLILAGSIGLNFVLLLKKSKPTGTVEKKLRKELDELKKTVELGRVRCDLALSNHEQLQTLTNELVENYIQLSVLHVLDREVVLFCKLKAIQMDESGELDYSKIYERTVNTIKTTAPLEWIPRFLGSLTLVDGKIYVGDGELYSPII